MFEEKQPLSDSEKLGFFQEAAYRNDAHRAVQLFQRAGYLPMLSMQSTDFTHSTGPSEDESCEVSRYVIDYQPIDFGPHIQAGAEIESGISRAVIALTHLFYLRGDRMMLLRMNLKKPFHISGLGEDYLFSLEATLLHNGLDELSFLFAKDTGRKQIGIRCRKRGLFGMMEDFSYNHTTETPIKYEDNWPPFSLHSGVINLLDERKIRAILRNWPENLTHLWTDLEGDQAMRQVSMCIIEQKVSEHHENA